MHATYKKMLKGMEKNEAGRPAEPWFLYILKCGDGSFYTGITKDIAKRLKMHNAGTGARYTRSRLPVELLYQESCSGRTGALVRECAVKALGRKQKEQLIGVLKKKRVRRVQRPKSAIAARISAAVSM